jgi:hypothetical protein
LASTVDVEQPDSAHFWIVPAFALDPLIDPYTLLASFAIQVGVDGNVPTVTGWHCPPLGPPQVPPWQGWPHAPQLAASFNRFTHALPHGE